MEKATVSCLVQGDGEIGNNAGSSQEAETRSVQGNGEIGNNVGSSREPETHPVQGNGEFGNNAGSSREPESRFVQGNGEKGNNSGSSQDPEANKGKTEGDRKNHERVVKKRRKDSQVLANRKYSLRTSHTSARVLHCMSESNNKAPSESVNTPVQPAAKRRRGRPPKGSPKNECMRIRQRVRYILNRMNYEQSLIQAYASEGWKGQSLDKIRPEKELERAKAEILRCKLRIREAFQNIDSLLSEGKLEEYLFDSAGEISSEDIFCAICGSKDATLNNDIILCDGVCDRGFHQNCLNPPLLTKDIPPGDEGWLCPACDCKIDCIDVLNELQGSTLSIHDSWEKVFPEAASLANGSKQSNVSDLPSDDSEDNDYDPTMAERYMVDQEDSSSKEDEDEGSDSENSDFLTSSEDSEPSKKKRAGDDLGLPSEDSEDVDFDPTDPASNKDQKDQSSSDESEESDFTSDSDDFCAEIAKSCGQDEVSTPSLSGVKAVDHTDRLERSSVDTQPIAANSNLTSMETELNQDIVLPVSRRRQVERLDYKKLYDEAYGKASCDSSDEEWSGKSTPQKGNEEDSETDSLVESLNLAQRSSRRTSAGHQNFEHAPQSDRQSLHPDALHGSVSEHCTGVFNSNGSSSTARKRHFGPIINQRLQEYFKIEPYPSRETKETLAQDLELTFHQVSKWFASTRHYTRVATAKKGKHPENHNSEKNDLSAVAGIQVREPEERVMEKLTVDRNYMVSEERMAESSLKGGYKQDSPSKLDISCEQGVAVTPVSSQSYATTSRKVGRPKGGSTQNQGNGTSRNVGKPKGGSAQNQIPGLDDVDEARKKAILRELRKKKMGR